MSPVLWFQIGLSILSAVTISSAFPVPPREDPIYVLAERLLGQLKLNSINTRSLQQRFDNLEGALARVQSALQYLSAGLGTPVRLS